MIVARTRKRGWRERWFTRPWRPFLCEVQEIDHFAYVAKFEYLEKVLYGDKKKPN